MFFITHLKQSLSSPGLCALSRKGELFSLEATQLFSPPRRGMEMGIPDASRLQAQVMAHPHPSSRSLGVGGGVPPRDPGTQGCMLPCVLSHHLGIKNGPSEAFLKHSESVCIALPALKASEHYGIQSPRTTEETGWCCPSSRLGQTTNSCMVNYGSLPFSFSLDNLSFRNKR